MTKITGTYKTYSSVGDDMVHTGYFITSNNYQMKYATKWQWESVKPSHMRVHLDRVLSRLPNAQGNS